jgi:hypothetical protein
LSREFEDGSVSDAGPDVERGLDVDTMIAGMSDGLELEDGDTNTGPAPPSANEGGNEVDDVDDELDIAAP